jgi:hypothetical protein
MTDERKFRIFSSIVTILILLIISYNLSQEYLMTELGGYLKRRIYYETVIKKKGLSLHRAEYWRKKE